VNIKIAGKWMFIPLKMVLIGIDPTPYEGPKKEKYAPHLCIGLYQLKPALGSAGQQTKILKGLSKDGKNMEKPAFA